MKNQLQINLRKGSGKEPVRIAVTGDLLFSDAAALHKKFIEAAGAGSSLTLELNRCATLDLPCLQLLISLQRTLTSAGKEFSIETSESEELEQILSRTGFDFLVKK